MSLAVDLDHRAGSFHLRVSFRSEGRLTALFGRSGSGKTTLVNAIAGLLRPERGRVVVDGTVLVDTASGLFVPAHRRRIGYVFQDPRLFPHLTVRQNLLFGRWFLPRAARSGPGHGLDEAVALLGLEPLLARRPAGLSGGEKQRVAIGRALLARPKLLLMDEPLASLDEARKAEILPHLERLRDEAGIPIVYVSHAVAEVVRLAATVVVLEGGRVAAAGPVEAVLGGDADRAPLSVLREGGAVLPARVAAHHAEDGLTGLATPAGPLLVPALGMPVGAELRVLVQARDVMLSLGEPRGVSALNVLPGRVVSIGPREGASCDVALRCGDGTLLARVTARSVASLGLAPGQPVHAVVKAVSLDGSRSAAG